MAAIITPTYALSIRLDVQLAAKLQRLAQRDNSSISAVTRAILTRGVEELA